MSDNHNVFRFDLNESLYFERGQEVSEMIGISLDPEISIQSFEEYVSIRGVIELVGEYKLSPPSDDGADDEVLYFDDHHSKRYIESVVYEDDDRAYFSHRFPVEISVPSYRIADIDDVTVHVESFDYELPDQSQLIIKSKVDIYGIHDEVEGRLNEDDMGTTSEEEPVFHNTLDETFHFDVTDGAKEEDALIDHEDPNELANMDESEETTTEDKDRWLLKPKSQTLDEFFGKEPEANEVTETEDQLHENEENEVDEGVTADDAYVDQEEDRDEDEPKDVHYLADLFREGEEEEEEHYTKMRLCIVQSDDSLEKIADRYHVTTLQLLKRNNMEDDDLSEGQLLYIPSKSNPIDYD